MDTHSLYMYINAVVCILTEKDVSVKRKYANSGYTRTHN